MPWKPEFANEQPGTMRTFFYPIAFVISIGFFGGCNKTEDLPPYPQSAFAPCHGATRTWDVPSISDSLVGQWLWVYQRCTDFDSYGHETDTANLVIDIKPNNTLVVFRHGIPSDTLDWHLTKEGNAYHVFNKSGGSIPAYGRIFFCGNELMLNGSYRDLCDNVFRRE